MKKLMLIDGNSLLFRAYYATAYGNPKGVLRSRDGIPTNAIFALANIILKLLETNHPEYAVVAFDTAAPTLRHQKYEQYKAGRVEVPEDLVTQFPLARELLTHLGLKCHEQEGYEADDIIGTMARLGEQEGLTVEIYSGDRDLLQLISPSTTVFLTKKGLSELQVMNATTLKETFGLTPQQVPDFKGLMGDPSDNIPGIPGVGEKTALKLLAEYHTMEAILAADIKGKLGETIKQNKDVGLFSKEMATIIRDMPLPFDIHATAYEGIRITQASAFFQRYDMTSLIKKLSVTFEPQSEFQPIPIVEQLNEALFMEPCSIVVALAGDSYHVDAIYGFAIANASQAVYIRANDAKHNPLFAKALLEHPFLSEDSKRLRVVAHRLGLTVGTLRHDALLAAFLLNPGLKDEAASIYRTFQKELPALPAFFDPRHPSDQEWANLTGSKAQLLIEIEPLIEPELSAKNLWKLYRDVDFPLAKVLAQMEIDGAKLDVALITELSQSVAQKITALEKQIYNLAGHPFNLNSPSQMAVVLFDELQLPSSKKRSTAADIIEGLKDLHPIIPLILDYRRYAKLQSTYLQALPTYVLADGKIHSIFQQALVQTGRLSSKDPNLQNITIRDEESKEIRKAFIASYPGGSILSMDYSQIELRVLAGLAKAQSMIEAFHNRLDIHTQTAMKVFGVAKDQVTSSMRRQAKAVNFGIVYGISDWGLSEQLGITPSEAKTFIQRYFETYPEIKGFFEMIVKDCEVKGYVQTILGRYRYVPEMAEKNYNLREYGKRIAMNSPIQGSAADVIKLAMIKIDQIIHEKRLKTKMILQVHDELVFDVPNEEITTVIPLFKNAMIKALDVGVELDVEYHYGFNWFHD